MTLYQVKAQGYGGSGPSVPTFESTDIKKIKERIADLVQSDHAVQLYCVNADGSTASIDFETYSTITVEIYNQ